MTGLALVIPDLILGGMRSIQARYLMLFGYSAAVAYLLATQIASPLQTWATENLAACLTYWVAFCPVLQFSSRILVE